MWVAFVLRLATRITSLFNIPQKLAVKRSNLEAFAKLYTLRGMKEVPFGRAAMRAKQPPKLPILLATGIETMFEIRRA